MGKSALISGTGIGSGPEAIEAAAILVDAAAIEANCTVGTDTNSSLKVFAIASSSSVASRAGAFEEAKSESSGRVLLVSLASILFGRAAANVELVSLVPVLSGALLKEY